MPVGGNFPNLGYFNSWGDNWKEIIFEGISGGEISFEGFREFIYEFYNGKIAHLSLVCDLDFGHTL